jgi:nucleoside 2-deoxyribosyltransferase
VKSIYVIGSLRNTNIPRIGNLLRSAGFDAFDDWYAAGPEADDKWKEYESGRNRTYQQALSGYAAQHVYDFDVHHLDRVDAGLLVAPAGKSAHLELGYIIGRGKPGYILTDDPDRWDVMTKFAKSVFFTEGDMLDTISRDLA